MARIFNGSNTYLRVTPAVRNALAVTYAAWVKPATSGSAAGNILSQADEGGGNNWSGILQYLGARTYGRMNTTTTFETDTPVSLAADEWQLVVGVVVSDVSYSVYNNSEKQTQTTDAGTFVANYDNVTIGALRRSTLSNYFNGKIHSAAIWNKALTDAEVAALQVGAKLGSVARSNLVGLWSDLGGTLVGEVGGTLTDVNANTTTDTDAPAFNTGLKRVFALSDVTGLRRWVDYVPVKVSTSHTSATVGRHNDNGALLVEPLGSVSGLTAWRDYIPVYVVTDNDANAWRYNDAGFLWVTGV